MYLRNYEDSFGVKILRVDCAKPKQIKKTRPIPSVECMIYSFDFPLMYENHFCGCDLIATNIKPQFLKIWNLLLLDNSILLQNDCLINWFPIHNHGNVIFPQLERCHGIQTQGVSRNVKSIFYVKVLSIYHSIKASKINSIHIRVTIIWNEKKNA